MQGSMLSTYIVNINHNINLKPPLKFERFELLFRKQGCLGKLTCNRDSNKINNEPNLDV